MKKKNAMRSQNEEKVVRVFRMKKTGLRSKNQKNKNMHY